MSFEEHEGIKFLEIDPAKYISEHVNINNCLIGSKTANITAVKGKVGQAVKTIMKDGFTETTNVVSYDVETGEPDWIVTQASGEQMVVNDTKFKSLYEKSDATAGEEIKPLGKFRSMIRLDEDVAFKASWGDMQYIKKGGVLVVLANNDIYGIQKEEFEQSYKVITEKDEQALNLLNENLAVVSKKTPKPTIFLSVAYPYDSEEDQKILKSIIRYINSKGIKAVNIRNSTGENINILNEISKCLTNCEGILALAFNKGKNKTSPFIQIETAMAHDSNLETLMIIPKLVEREGVLFEGNVDGKAVELDNSADLQAFENNEVIKNLDTFIEKVTKRFEFKITDEVLAQFREGLFDVDEKEQTKQNLVNFLKNFYQTDEDFDFDNVFIKKPVQIKAVAIETDGVYETKNGKTFLKAGDFLVTDLDGKVYSVDKKEFETRYIKVNGEKDKYISKVIPTIAKQK
ncbi:MAG: hypothetical protein J5779_03125, partial [Clostridia bacterium]|nr:hypothetical protein [Clostridia bacterium]